MSNLPSDDDQNQPQVTGITAPAGGQKEKPAFADSFGEAKQEVTPITEFTKNVDLEPEVEGWLEKLEKEDHQLQQPVVNQQTGQVVLDNHTPPGTFKVVLPLTKDEVEKGLHLKVIDSMRWLAEWCTRLIKMFGNKVAYRRA